MLKGFSVQLCVSQSLLRLMKRFLKIWGLVLSIKRVFFKCWYCSASFVGQTVHHLHTRASAYLKVSPPIRVKKFKFMIYQYILSFEWYLSPCVHCSPSDELVIYMKGPYFSNWNLPFIIYKSVFQIILCRAWFFRCLNHSRRCSNSPVILGHIFLGRSKLVKNWK